MIQANDVGTGHLRQRNHTKNMKQKYLPHIGLTDTVTQMLQAERNAKNLVVSAPKMKLMINAITHYANFCQKSFNESSIVESFVKPGLLDETLQGPDVLKMFGTYKGERPTDMTQKWIKDLPTFIKDVAQFGYVKEETFDRLEYPIDMDLQGNEYPLPTNVATQHHMQRSTILNHEHLMEAFRQASVSRIVSQESSASDLAREQRWRNEQLQGSAKIESILHQAHGNDPVSSERELLSTYKPKLDTIPLSREACPLQNLFDAVE